MTTLNKTIRQQIIDNVIASTEIPARKEALIKQTQNRVRALCVERVPKDFAASVKNLPAEWFPHLVDVDIPPEICPVSLCSWDNDQIARHWRCNVSFEPIKHSFDARFYRKDRAKENGDDGQSWETVLADLIVIANEIKADEDTARRELSSFLYSVTTYKTLLQKMPELEPHLPGLAAKAMPLVVSVDPLKKTLSGLGFPK